MWRRTMVVASVMIVALALAACGDSDSDDAAEPSATSAAPETTEGPQDEGITVVAEDLRFSAATFRVAPGPVEITYRNDGQAVHTLVIEGVDGFRLNVPEHGDVDMASVDLAPGNYTIFCDVPGHREAGMQATLAVA